MIFFFPVVILTASFSFCLQIGDEILKSLIFLLRLREYEYEIDVSTSRGPEVERIYFVIIEMARKILLLGPLFL